MDDSELLREAIERDDASAVASLADSGVDIEEEYYWSYPIHHATFAGRLNAIRVLAEKGTNLNVIGLRDSPPLRIAVDDRKPAVVKLLLELGADPDVRDGTQRITPLHRALWRKDSLESARLLVEHGADIYAKDWSGNTAIRDAVFFECDDIVELMIKIHGSRVRSAVTKARKDFAMIAAAEGGDIDGVKRWLGSGANVNALDPFGDCALRFAAGSGRIKLMKLLLKNGAEIGLRHYGGKTALLDAALFGHRDAVDLLLDAGADLLEEYVPGEVLAGGRDMDAVAFAREGLHFDLAEYLRARKTELKRLRKKQEKEAATPDPHKESQKRAKPKLRRKKSSPGKSSGRTTSAKTKTKVTTAKREARTTKKTGVRKKKKK